MEVLIARCLSARLAAKKLEGFQAVGMVETDGCLGFEKLMGGFEPCATG